MEGVSLGGMRSKSTRMRNILVDINSFNWSVSSDKIFLGISCGRETLVFALPQRYGLKLQRAHLKHSPLMVI